MLLLAALVAQFRYKRCVPPVYWPAVVFFSVLGTLITDNLTGRFHVPLVLCTAVFAVLLAAAFGAWCPLAHRRLALDAVLAFWLAYVLTRPLGASIGDGLSQPSGAGGLGIGTTGTSHLFLACILGLVAFLSTTRRDQTRAVGA